MPAGSRKASDSDTDFQEFPIRKIYPNNKLLKQSFFLSKKS